MNYDEANEMHGWTSMYVFMIRVLHEICLLGT